jgi:aspartyl-tRNA(Asn)/glutamyl-tRNA(Gln) amidotransferase subunit A
MHNEDLLFMPATRAAALIRTGSLSPVEYIDAVLAQAEAQQPRCNAFATLDAEGARAQARIAEQAVMDGKPLGPLHGIPVSVKDLFATAGLRTAYGSAMHEDDVPDHDDVLVARIRSAGGIVFGKTTTPEYGHKGLTDSPVFGTTRNPWNLQRTSGGSSGGAGVAAALGIGPLALGSDGAGSIRIPAAACGIVGLKPTTGAVPFQETRDAFGNNTTAGPMARTVGDAALLLSVLRGPDPCDPWSLNAPAAGRIDPRLVSQDLSGIRIGVICRMTNPRLAIDMGANMDRAAAVLAARGAIVEPVEDAIDWIEYQGRIIYLASFFVSFQNELAQWGNRMDPCLRTFIERGSAFSLSELREAQLARTGLYRAIQGLFARYDYLMSPSLTRTALPADFDAAWGEVDVDGQLCGITRQGWTSYSYPFNLTGFPAASFPSGWGTDGLPTAVQIVGPWWSDESVLRLGAVLEHDQPWADRRPPMA